LKNWEIEQINITKLYDKKTILSQRKHINCKDLSKLYIKHFSIGFRNFSFHSLLSHFHHFNINAMSILFEVTKFWPDRIRTLERLRSKTCRLMQREIMIRPDVALRAQRYMIELNKLKIKIPEANFVIIKIHQNFDIRTDKITEIKKFINLKARKFIHLS